MYINLQIIISVAMSIVVSSCIFLFAFKKTIDHWTNRSLAKHQSELNKQLETLKASNARASHILTALYDEEAKALKEVSGLLNTATDNVYRLACLYDHTDTSKMKKTYRTHGEECSGHMDKLRVAMNRNCIFIDDKIYSSIEALEKSSKSILEVIDNEDPLCGDVQASIDNLREGLNTVIKDMKSHLESKKHEHLGDIVQN